MSFGGGFSVLAWVKPTANILANIKDPSSIDEMQKILLGDVCSLWGIRWGMDVSIVTHDHQLFCYGVHTRINVGTQTLRNALGDLGDHIDFIRGTPHNTSQDLAQYKLCREKWKVDDQPSESTTGWAEQAQEGTSHGTKRRRI